MFTDKETDREKESEVEKNVLHKDHTRIRQSRFDHGICAQIKTNYNIWYHLFF